MQYRLPGAVGNTAQRADGWKLWGRTRECRGGDPHTLRSNSMAEKLLLGSHPRSGHWRREIAPERSIATSIKTGLAAGLRPFRYYPIKCGVGKPPSPVFRPFARQLHITDNFTSPQMFS
jgi:hypothetical protein